jgi:hypothetical protein
MEQREQNKLNPPTVTIEEVIESDHGRAAEEPPTDYSEPAVENADVFGDHEDQDQDKYTEQVLSVPEGEQEMSPEREAVPSDNPGEAPLDADMRAQGLGEDGIDSEIIEVD